MKPNQTQANPAKPLRQTMPAVAAFIDDCRAAFGREAIDGQIRNGLAGLPHFHARENGQQIGCPMAEGTGISGAALNLPSAAELARRAKG